ARARRGWRGIAPGSNGRDGIAESSLSGECARAIHLSRGDWVADIRCGTFMLCSGAPCDASQSDGRIADGVEDAPGSLWWHGHLGCGANGILPVALALFLRLASITDPRPATPLSRRPIDASYRAELPEHSGATTTQTRSHRRVPSGGQWAGCLLAPQARCPCYKPARSSNEATTFSASKISFAIARASREW